eukprot:6862332-Prymnesium_polylepis.1
MSVSATPTFCGPPPAVPSGSPVTDMRPPIALHEAWVDLLEVLISQPILGEPADLEVLDQDVRLGSDRTDNLLTFRGRHVQCERLLASVARQKVCGRVRTLAVVVEHEGWTPAASVVADLWPLHLDHLRAEIGESLSRPWPCEHSAQIEDADV